MTNNQQRYVLIINIFIAVTIVVLVATLYLTFTFATVSVPGSRVQYTNEATIAVHVDPSEDEVKGEIVSREYELSDTLPVGVNKISATKAGGIVTLINNYSQNQTLVNTTRLLTSENRLFRITESISVAPGERVDVFAEADQEGDEFLIGPTTFIIPGLWEGIQDQIFAESSSAMTYDRYEEAEITAEDVASAEDDLLQQIIDQALEDFQELASEGVSIERDQIAAASSDVIVDPPIGTKTNQMTVSVKGTVSQLVMSTEDLLDRTREKLMQSLANENLFLELIPDSLHYSIASFNNDDNTAELQTQVTAWINGQEQPMEIEIKALTGKTRRSALRILSEQGITDSQITTSPSWIPILPFLIDHITVEIQ